MYNVRLFCAIVALSFLPLVGLAHGQPPPPPPPAPGRDAATTNKTGTARLAGRVTSLETGRPIRRAVVRAFGNELREGKSVSTDAEGRWELRDLPAGRISLSANKGGYVMMQYGQRRPFEQGKPIDLANGQAIDKIELALPRASVISGRVVDEFGEPVTDVRVTTLRYRFVSGQRRLTQAGAGDTTDDLGQFRVHGLSPGDYYLVAQPQSVMSFMSASIDRTGYVQTYYPSAYVAGEATKVALAVGQEAQGLVITLAPTRFVTLSGTAATSDGQPVRAGMVRLVDPGAPAPGTFVSGMIRPDGTWSISSVVPGEYRLMAQMLRGSLEEVAATGSATFPETVQMPITVGSEDLTGIVLTTSKGGVVRGQVKWEGGTPPAANPSLGSIMAWETDAMVVGPASGAFKEDGTFEIRNVQGKRQLRAGGFPRGWSLKSITLNGQDITDTMVDVSAGQELSGVVVHLTQNAAEVTGTVQSSKGTAIADYVVVLFAPESERWTYPSRFVHVSRPDQTGRFTISGVPEATYLAVALEYMEPGEETNPEFLEKLKALATRVSVGEGEKKTLTLKLSAQ